MRFVLLSLIPTLLLSCATLKELASEAVRSPTLQFESASLRDVSLSGATIDIAYRLENPNPLGVTLNYAQFLKKHCPKMTVEDLQKHADVIARNGRKMQSIIDELLLLASVRKQEEIAFAPLKLGKIVAEAQGRLGFLAEEPSRVRTREEIIARVWDEHWWGSTKTLDVHVASLRRKLGDDHGWITTLRGVGYRFDPPG